MIVKDCRSPRGRDEGCASLFHVTDLDAPSDHQRTADDEYRYVRVNEPQAKHPWRMWTGPVDAPDLRR